MEEGLGATKPKTARYSHLLSLQYYRAYRIVHFRSRHLSSTNTSFETYEREKQMARQLSFVDTDIENVFRLVHLHVITIQLCECLLQCRKDFLKHTYRLDTETMESRNLKAVSCSVPSEGVTKCLRVSKPHRCHWLRYITILEYRHVFM